MLPRFSFTIAPPDELTRVLTVLIWKWGNNSGWYWGLIELLGTVRARSDGGYLPILRSIYKNTLHIIHLANICFQVILRLRSFCNFVFSGYLWSGVVWCVVCGVCCVVCGVVWFMVWCGVWCLFCGVEWYVVLCVVWCGVWCCVLCGVVLHGVWCVV